MIHNNEDVKKIITEVIDELTSAENKHPGWPVDPFHAAAILTEEVGEVAKAVIDTTYANASPLEVRAEAIQVAAMAIRFIYGFDNYQFAESDQR